MKVHYSLAVGLTAVLLAGCQTSAPTGQTTAAAAPAAATAAPTKPAAAGPDSLQVLFPVGSAEVTPPADGVIDHAARLFREGNPVVMTVAGHADPQGAEFPNLILSAKRAAAVKAALVSRGIPGDRLELAAFGAAEPAEPKNPSAPENHRVVITWR